MNKCFKIFLVILPILSLGMMFHFIVDVTVRFDNIDDVDDENLKLRFEIKDNKKTKKIISPGSIVIRRNDSIVMSLVNDSNVFIDHWDFPSVPDGFRVIYRVSGDNPCQG